MTSFVSELRRRNVLRAAATYALIAWIIIEAGSVLLPTFGAPEWAFQVYVLTVFAGFIVSLILSWIFEVTPEGIRRDSELEGQVHSSRQSRQKMNVVIIGLLVVALAVSITLNVTGIRNGDDRVATESGRRSVAVLPFKSLSSNPDNRLFADGIHDDLLNKLATLGSFKVISRTSVMEYRDTAKGLGEIAAELGVNTVLEGTVQRVGDNVRINMQLIDVATDENLWAQSFDRRLTVQNIFDIQSEVSRAISGSLRAALSPEETDRLATIPTADLRAYSLYTAGRNNLYQRRRETLLQAREQFERAVEIDPDYAEAHAGLAESILLLMINHQEIPHSEAIALTQQSLDRALELDPNLADAYAILGLMKQHVWSQDRIGNEDREAEAAFEKALALNPNHASAYMWYASLRDSQQRLEESTELYERSLQLDPLGRIPWSNLPGLYAQRGLNQEAIDAWVQAIAIHPEWPTPYGYMAVHMAGLGRLDEALAWNEKARSISSDRLIGSNIEAGIYYEFGDFERAKQQFLDVPPSHPTALIGDAIAMLIDGNNEDAMRSLDDVVATGMELPRFVYDLASDVALVLGDYDKSRRYALLEDPILASDTPIVIDRFTVDNIIRLAYIYRQTGDPARARQLAEQSLPVIEDLPRLGMYGHGVLDVEAYVVMGRQDDALDALEQAVADGLRSTFMSDTWPIELNPLLEEIWDEPRFRDAQAEMEKAIDGMRERAVQAEADGTLDDLRQLAASNADLQI